jgi:hypothetical protein
MFRPASLPVRRASEGAPKGVLILIHFWFVKPSIWYKPLPPMMPMRFSDMEGLISEVRPHIKPEGTKMRLRVAASGRVPGELGTNVWNTQLHAAQD